MPLFEMTFSYSIWSGLTSGTEDHEWDVMLCMNQRQKAIHKTVEQALEIHTDQLINTVLCAPVCWPINN